MLLNPSSLPRISRFSYSGIPTLIARGFLVSTSRHVRRYLSGKASRVFVDEAPPIGSVGAAL